MASRADNTSVADSGRSDGLLANRRIINASKGRGHCPLCQVGLSRRSVHVLADDGHCVVSQEGRPSRYHLVEHGTQRVEVHFGLTLASHGLFRWHVGHRPYHHPFLSEPGRATTTANPKSPILAIPPVVNHTLLGFRSRWTIPLE